MPNGYILAAIVRIVLSYISAYVCLYVCGISILILIFISILSDNQSTSIWVAAYYT